MIAEIAIRFVLSTIGWRRNFRVGKPYDSSVGREDLLMRLAQAIEAEGPVDVRVEDNKLSFKPNSWLGKNRIYINRFSFVEIRIPEEKGFFLFEVIAFPLLTLKLFIGGIFSILFVNIALYNPKHHEMMISSSLRLSFLSFIFCMVCHAIEVASLRDSLRSSLNSTGADR